MIAQRDPVDRGSWRNGQIGHQLHIAGMVFPRGDHATRDTGNLDAAGLYLSQFDAVAAHLDLEIKATHVLHQAIVAPPPTVAGPVDARVAAVDRHMGKAFGRQFGLVHVPLRQADACDADFSGHADGAELLTAVQDPDAGVVEGAPDCHAKRHDDVALHEPEGRPHGRFGRSVKVPEFGATVHQLERQVDGHRLCTEPGTKTWRTFPSRIDKQAPQHRCRLHDGDVLRFEQHAHLFAIHGSLARHQHNLCTHGQGKHDFRHGHVERLRGDGAHALVRAKPGLALHALHQVGRRAMQYAHALGATGRARGVDHIRQVVVLRRLGVLRQRCFWELFPTGIDIELQYPSGHVAAPVARCHLDSRGRQHQRQRGVFRVIVEPCLGKIRVQRDVGGTGLQHGQLRNDHQGFALHA